MSYQSKLSKSWKRDDTGDEARLTAQLRKRKLHGSVACEALILAPHSFEPSTDELPVFWTIHDDDGSEIVHGYCMSLDHAFVSVDAAFGLAEGWATIAVFREAELRAFVESLDWSGGMGASIIERNGGLVFRGHRTESPLDESAFDGPASVDLIGTGDGRADLPPLPPLWICGDSWLPLGRDDLATHLNNARDGLVGFRLFV